MEEVTGLKTQFKWPNDLLLKGGKLGGILVEARTLGDRLSFAIVGTGLNVNQPSGLLPNGATSLRLVSGSQYDIQELLSSILKQTRSRYEDLNDSGKIMREWWDNCAHRLRNVRIETPGGTITGIAKAVDLQGNLLVETGNNRIATVSDGSLSVLDDD